MPGLWVRASPGATTVFVEREKLFVEKENISPRPGIEPGPSTWQAEILTTRLSRNRWLLAKDSTGRIDNCDSSKIVFGTVGRIRTSKLEGALFQANCTRWEKLFLVDFEHGSCWLIAQVGSCDPPPPLVSHCAEMHVKGTWACSATQWQFNQHCCLFLPHFYKIFTIVDNFDNSWQ